MLVLAVYFMAGALYMVRVVVPGIDNHHLKYFELEVDPFICLSGGSTKSSVKNRVDSGNSIIWLPEMPNSSLGHLPATAPSTAAAILGCCSGSIRQIQKAASKCHFLVQLINLSILTDPAELGFWSLYGV